MRRYIDKDYATLVRWHKKWGQVAPDKAHLPEIGYVLEGKAMGFLYQTDGTFAFVEEIIRNPDTKEGVSEVIEALTSTARELGFSLVIGFTKVKKMTERVETLGFMQLPGDYTGVVRRIR